MKQEELIKKLKRVENHIKKTELISNCIKVAKTYGHGETTVHDFHTNENYKFSENGISIHYDDGLNYMGGGYLKVDLAGKGRVFHLNRYQANPLYPHAGGFYVYTYLPGDWEAKINNLAEKGPEKGSEKPKKEKEKNPLEAKVSADVLSEIKNRFRI
jgi:hypothetical protein